MKYTKSQIEKLIFERDWLRSDPTCQDLAQREAELREIMATDADNYFEAVATVYGKQEEVA